MQQKFRLEGLTCPNCSLKIENAMRKIDAVEEASINLIRQELSLKTAPAAGYDWEETVRQVVRQYEPEVAVKRVAENPAPEKSLKERNQIVRLVIGTVLYGISLLLFFREAALPLQMAFFGAAYGVLGGDVLVKALRNIGQRELLDENFLMGAATIGAWALGEYPEAVAVMLFYQIGEYYQELAVDRSRRSIAELMDVRPDTAVVQRGGWQTVAPETVVPGELIRVNPGEKLPLDGVVRTGSSYLDTRFLTGEPVERPVQPGDEVWAGCVNQSGQLLVEVSKPYGESTAAKMIGLVENAASRKAPAEQFITVFSRYYTPVVVGAAILLALLPPLLFGQDFSPWFRRGLVFLVISCPCALVLSVPLAFFGGIGAASRQGILVKGGNYLDALTKVSVAAFDKTGTLTKGTFQVTALQPEPGVTEEELLRWAAGAEHFSAHPIARSICGAWGQAVDEAEISGFAETAGGGVRAWIQGREVVAGKAAFLAGFGINCPPSTDTDTRVYVAREGRLLGNLTIADELKEDSRRAVRRLKKLGVKKCVLLTGDNAPAAERVAETLKLDACYANLLPQEKLEKVEALMREKGPKGALLFAGDGMNDAPVLARADVGVAMGALGTDAAIAAADVVLMTDAPYKLVEAIRIARYTKTIARQNIILTLSVKALFLLMGALGAAGLWEAVFADVGVMVLAVLNAARTMKRR